ncbi:transmembrane and coiled-coil domain-containing protein 4-like isoform X2 [Mya arenaria]|uniref:transmembrane and coiled-coil domain-containing protein 4-like isoform X2 n=1 Tax=Mya arenaria TaxID=6604 RepID=UPI0022DF48BE|nr:transmembrane and coiled-coil domain-containing protein 4-like isoform X2 [Mya arenaria]
MSKNDDSIEEVSKTSLPNNTERFHKKLTDVSLYSVAGLCAVSLVQLFDEDCHSAFKKSALEKILKDLGQPEQTNESMFSLLDGEIITDSDVFVDNLLEDPVLSETRQPLIQDFILLAIQEGCYDARMRVLIKHMAWQLRVSWEDVEELEGDLSETLEYQTYIMSEEEEKEKARKSRSRKIKRYALIGLATVGGGALIGLTGGLAAPFVAAGAGAIIGGAGAAALGSVAGVAIIGSLFGVAGAGLTGYKMKRRVGAIEEFSFQPLTLIGSKFDSQRTVKQLHITIAVTGWLSEKVQDFRIPWSCLAESREQYSLCWESKYIREMGRAIDYLVQTGMSVATTEALKYTVLSGIIAAIAWPSALISAAGVIDNPWHVCTQRATETGKQLAEVLLGREQGNRPVTLIGFSLGARVIFSCLEEMSKRKGSEGLIEDVILLGAPVSGDAKYWKPISKVVAGKIVNGYARGDWLLKFLYRTASVTFNVAGLAPVKWENRRMHNIDLSNVIDGHSDYIKNLDTIMKAVGVRTKDELQPPCFSSSSSKSSLKSSKSTSSDLQKGKSSEGVSNLLKGESQERLSDLPKGESLPEKTDGDLNKEETTNGDTKAETSHEADIANSSEERGQSGKNENDLKDTDENIDSLVDHINDKEKEKNSETEKVPLKNEKQDGGCRSTETRHEAEGEKLAGLVSAKISVPLKKDTDKEIDSHTEISHENSVIPTQESATGSGNSVNDKTEKDKVKGRAVNKTQVEGGSNSPKTKGKLSKLNKKVQKKMKVVKESYDRNFCPEKPNPLTVSYKNSDDEGSNVEFSKGEKASRGKAKAEKEADEEDCFFTDSDPPSENEQ